MNGLLMFEGMIFRLMSDYEVTLINDSMQEFYVRFHGPTESELFPSVVSPPLFSLKRASLGFHQVV
jgi:ubiquitin-conjugating enzyme E2 H